MIDPQLLNYSDISRYYGPWGLTIVMTIAQLHTALVLTTSIPMIHSNNSPPSHSSLPHSQYPYDP
jgi:hypothetical protein